MIFKYGNDWLITIIFTFYYYIFLIIYMSNGLQKTYPELEKSVPHIIVEIIEYVPNSVLSKTIIKKTTGNITAMAFDAGEELTERAIPFDSFVQVIDGNAEVMINKKSTLLTLGQGIIIPAHALSMIKANERFKIILTVIKSGYDDRI